MLRVSLSSIENHLDRPGESEGEVLEAARRGDRDALETLVSAHYDRVYALCRRMLGNEPDALDATQDTLVAAIRALARFDGRSSFGTWIYRIATNTCIDEMRRRRRRPVTGMAADIAEVADEVSFGAPGLFLPTRRDVGTQPDAATQGDEDAAEIPVEARDTGHRSWSPDRGSGSTRHDLRLGGGPDPADLVAARVDIDAALASLPHEFRVAIVLRDVCDLPYDEIATILGVPVGTVRSRIARARTALATLWQAEEPERRGSSEEAAPDVSGNLAASPIVKTNQDVARRSQEEEHTQ